MSRSKALTTAQPPLEAEELPNFGQFSKAQKRFLIVRAQCGTDMEAHERLVENGTYKDVDASRQTLARWQRNTVYSQVLDLVRHADGPIRKLLDRAIWQTEVLPTLEVLRTMRDSGESEKTRLEASKIVLQYAHEFQTEKKPDRPIVPTLKFRRITQPDGSVGEETEVRAG